MLLSQGYTVEFIIRIYLIAAFILFVAIQELWLLLALALPVLVVLIYALLKKKKVVEKDR